jgi:hypothetical protein
MAHITSKGLRQQVYDALDFEKWQTSSIIAGQLVFRPETLVRVSFQARRQTHDSGSRTHLVCRELYGLLTAKRIERRKNADGLWEYRKIS